MNVDALIVFLVLLGGLLAIPVFSYGGHVVLHWLRMLHPSQVLVSSTGGTAPKADAADAKPALDRLDDDGGNQGL
jgi:hypothetical protein